MNILQVLSFGLDVYRRFSRQKINKSTYHAVAGAFRNGCSKEEWESLGYRLGIVDPE